MTRSGATGILGALADAWDSIPVKGPMAILVAAIGTGLAITSGALSEGDCSSSPLKGVYHPDRFNVVQKCAEATGTVIAWRHEHDGDYHVSMTMDDPGWTNQVNVDRQHGYTVVEFIPTMPHPKFRVGQRLKLTGTKVYDQQHKPAAAENGWTEMHPVFSVDEESVPASVVPNPMRLAPPTEMKP